MAYPSPSSLKFYQKTVLLSILLTLVGFTYNVWRMELTEENSNIRTACFEMLLELSLLEQLVYAAHYDKNEIEGSPRKGWVKVGLIADLSVLTNEAVQQSAEALKTTWSDHWETMVDDVNSTKKIVANIDQVRLEIKQQLASLK